MSTPLLDADTSGTGSDTDVGAGGGAWRRSQWRRRPMRYLRRMRKAFKKVRRNLFVAAERHIPRPGDYPLRFAKSILGLCSALFFTAGAWDYTDNHLNKELGLAYKVSSDVAGTGDDPNFSLAKESILFALGIVMMVLTSSFFVNATLNVEAPLRWRVEGWSKSSNHVLRHLQITVGLFGSIFYWVGGYNLVDLHIFSQDMSSNYNAAFIGLVLLHVSNAFRLYAGIYVEGDPEVFSNCTTGRKCYLVAAALVSLCGGVCVWRGVNNILTYQLWTSRPLTRDAIVTAIGFVMFIATHTLLANAGFEEADFEASKKSNTNQKRSDIEGTILSPIADVVVEIDEPSSTDDDDEPSPDNRQYRAGRIVAAVPFEMQPWDFRLRRNAQAVVALTAAFLFWTGSWNLVTLYYYTDSKLRDELYVVGGYLLMVLTGTLLTHSGINPGSTLNTLAGPHDEELQIELSENL